MIWTERWSPESLPATRHDVGVETDAHLLRIALTFYLVVIARGAKRAVAIQLDCFVASLLAMTV